MEFFQFCFDRAHIAPIPRNWNPINRAVRIHFINAILSVFWYDNSTSRRCLISFKRLIVRKWNRDDIPYNNKSARQRIAISCKWRHESEIIRVYGVYLLDSAFIGVKFQFFLLLLLFLFVYVTYYTLTLNKQWISYFILFDVWNFFNH